MNDICGITIDLDDTLWPVEPVIDGAERRLYDWLSENCPRVTRDHTVDSMREVRLSIAQANHHVAHDLGELRRRSLARLIVHEAGYPSDLVDLAMAEFLEHRNKVELFSDAMPFLERASRSFPLLSITNGNADLQRIGLGHLFQHHVSAAEIGAAKPDEKLFRAACERLQAPPEKVLHIGDHPIQDILGAARAGMKTVWVNRTGVPWQEEHDADHEVTSLEQVLNLLPNHTPGGRR